MIDIYDILMDCCLPGLTREGGGKYNARCVVCGDSKKSMSKKRFWVLPPSGNRPLHTCYCFNCGYSQSIKTFLKEHYPDVHKQFFKKRFKNRREIPKVARVPERTPSKPGPEPTTAKGSTRLTSLEPDHLAVKYLDDRMIPKVWKKYLFYAENFRKFTNSLVPGKFEKADGEDRRLVIPFYTVDGKLFAFAGRSLEGRKPKYLTIKIDEDHPKIFGLERADFDRTVYIFEGQIDSLFIPNSLAMAGGIGNVRKLLEYAPKDRYVLVPDLEPRNQQVCDMIGECIDHGFGVSLLPHHMKKHGKDVNNFVLNSGMTPRQIYDMINENVTTGIKARIRYKAWKRVK
jgi:hypothetical protein